MKSHMDIRHTARSLLCTAFFIILALPLPALPASLTLATAPLTSSTTTTVAPNLMFLLDSSGSMAWNYLPDWANGNYCRSTTGTYDAPCQDQPLFQSPDFNGIYYNPAINYAPAVNADGTSKGSQASPWTSVKDDAYNIQSTSSTNLVTGYTDISWCTNNNYTDCLRNDNYILPGTVAGKTYATMNTTTSSGSGYVATGSPGSPTTAARSWGPHYYMMIPGEYCDSARLTNCQTTQTSNFSWPARLRWCSDIGLTTCQANRTSTYNIPRYPTKAVGAFATITVGSITSNTAVSSVKVGTLEILSGTTSSQNSATNVASRIASNINNCTSAKTGNCTVAGYSASVAGNIVTIFAPFSLGAITTSTLVTVSSGSKTISSTAFGGFVAPLPGSFVRVDIVPGTTSYPYPGTSTRASTRTDCAGTTCTYTEEMTNFANWWTYYQTRMQTMKSAVSRAFKQIDNRFRVGFIDLWGNNYLPIAKFDAGVGNVKDTWYKKLFSMNPNQGTPLRSALSRIGLIYAGMKPVGNADPMEYSCQQNFTLVTTDGYWNTDSASAVKKIDGTTLGNYDAAPTVRPMYEGPTATSGTLADVAKYYYDTDLRDPAYSNCTGALGVDVCQNNVFVSGTDTNIKQHMTTFTLGLGVDGNLAYTSDYATAKSGDYYNLTNGLGSPVVNWPVPVADTETAVDDLWHAAVNGQGVYFSAKNPDQLTTGINGVLNSIGAKVGAGAAAATSTLNPVAGDNFAYVASYTTVKWKGNLEARTINLTTGVVSEAATWCAENVITGSCAAPGTVVADTSGSSIVYNCVTPNSTAGTCGGVLVGTDCKVEIPATCTGTMAAKVGVSTDTRTIKMQGSGTSAGTLVDFSYGNLSATQQGYFAGNSLSQWSSLDVTQQGKASNVNLVNYLRGQTGFEVRASNFVNGVDNRIFRFREATLGDAIESQPAFVGKPYFNYTDPGYAAFVTAQASRARTVFMGTNDGMLHAFNAVDGTERWAYVPSMVIPNMWKLADNNYGNNHVNYVNGKPVVADVYDPAANAGAGGWRTILVAGLNGGGRGYYALDITDPATPTFLWEIDSSTEANLGYSFGYPVVTKKADGTWVVLLTSGYNNTGPGDGVGYLFVRNALTGANINRISTLVGNTTTPSGLSRVANWADDPAQNNTSVYAYGGDLLGNVWRFDINANTATKFAVLNDSSGGTQPITSRPELGLIDGKRVVFVATGKYLEVSDLTTTQQQTVYAIKDANSATPLNNPRLNLVQQTLTTSTTSGTRTASSNVVNFTTGLGWYVNLPDSGERVNVDLKLDLGLLIVPSTVPSSTVCLPGGYGWLNYFNYATGSNGVGIVSQQFNAPIVGVNVFYTPDGKRHISVVTSDHPTPDEPPKPPPQPDNSSFVGKKVIWRELIP